MISIIIFYPNKPAATFDFDYYLRHHFPMVLARLKPFGAERFEIERGLSTADGGSAQHVAIGRLFMRDAAGFQRGMEIHGSEIMADIPNYTNITPAVEIAELLPSVEDAT